MSSPEDSITFYALQRQQQSQQQKDVAAPENEEDNNPENENKSQSSTISSKGEGKKDKDVSKKHQALVEQAGAGSKKHPRLTSDVSREEQGDKGFKMTETQTTLPPINDLLLAKSSCCIPYMDPSMSDEEAKKCILSFINDERIPSKTCFNVFQTTLKLFNGGR
ncbi:hypothetical protein V8E53_010041, partial [Lactarius tabidus]